MSLPILKKRTGRELPVLMNNLFTHPLFGTSLFNLNGLLDENDLAFVPATNIIENGKDYQIELAVPGLERKDFKVEVENDTLIVSAEKEEEKKIEEKNYRSREFSYNSFCRSFSLPDNLKVDNINAEYQNGVLKITLPKKEATNSKPVKQIKVN